MMKLVLAIVNEEQVHDLMKAVTEEGYSVTKLATTGGFLRTANTTIICGTEEEKVEKYLEIVERICKSTKQFRPNSQVATIGTGFLPFASEVVVGGATCFVLDVDKFCKF